MSVLSIRVIAEQDTEVFRDVEVKADNTFLELHETIKDAYDFNDNELGSFYLSDAEWNKGQEIVLEDLGEGDEKPFLMEDSKISDHIEDLGDRMFYVYDFLFCKTFFLEVINKKEDENEMLEYPVCVRKVGETPEYDDPMATLSADDFLDDLPSIDDDEPQMESLDDIDFDSHDFSEYM